MKKLQSFPASIALVDFICGVCPVDAHIHVAMNGVWTDDNGSFRGQTMSSITTHVSVVRSWTYAGVTHWTLEKWEHDNGYRCTMVELTKPEFLSLIHLT